MAKVDAWKPEGATRERIIRAAFGLDSENGYRRTRVTDIERGARRVPGSRAIDTHPRSQEAVVAASVREVDAGIDSTLAAFERLAVEDVRTELTLIGRGLLVSFATWREPIALMLNETNQVPDLGATARSKVLDRTQRWLAAWLARQVDAGRLVAHDSDALAAVAIGSLLYQHLHTRRFEGPLDDVDDERLLSAWVHLFARLAA